MNSIRPLVTITILVVVGAYLYVKINEGPEQPAGADAWPNETIEDLPPLDTVAASATVETGAAPAWGGAGSPGVAAVPMDNTASTAGATALAPATSDVSTNSGEAPGALPAVPAIPELPALAGQVGSGPPAATPSVPIPNELPQNIPVAQYPDGSPAGAAAPSNEGVGGNAPQYQASPDHTIQQAGPTATAPPTDAQNATSGTASNGLSAVPAAPPDASQQPPVSENPLRQSAPPTAQTDPYTTSVYGQSKTAASASEPAAASFAASLPAIQMALDRRELSRALELLTPWHNDPSLAPAEAKQVEALLGQLAGTVVYSTEHQLEPARMVKTGETLQTIAKEYNVPWQLLGKINGIAAADQVRPGQELKVVRGPFSAVLDLNRKELTLTVDGRYAGKFAVTGTTSAPVGEGEWVVKGNTTDPRGVFLARPGASAQVSMTEGIFLAPSESVRRADGSITAVGLSDADTNEICDILSVGSRVVIRR